MTLSQLRRVRWAVRAVLTLAIAASVTGNVLHAHPNPISQSISAWPPVAFLLTVELISRVPMHRKWLSRARMAAMIGIAGIAAWISYWHQVAICARYGETDAAPYLLPLSIDGMVVVASVSLVELAGRIRAATAPSEPVPAETPEPVPDLPYPTIESLDAALGVTGTPAEPELVPEGVPADASDKRDQGPDDQQILARLRNRRAVPRFDDGSVPVRLVEDLFGISQDRAVRLMKEVGVYRPRKAATVPAGDDEPVPINGHNPVPTTEGSPS